MLADRGSGFPEIFQKHFRYNRPELSKRQCHTSIQLVMLRLSEHSIAMLHVGVMASLKSEAWFAIREVIMSTAAALGKNALYLEKKIPCKGTAVKEVLSRHIWGQDNMEPTRLHHLPDSVPHLDSLWH